MISDKVTDKVGEKTQLDAGWTTENSSGGENDFAMMLLRNWLMIATFVVLSCAIGALHYSKIEPSFVSTTDLYIESAKVPEIGDLAMGEQLNRNLSVGASMGMIQSELILGGVLEKVKYKDLAAFKGVGNPLQHLRKNIVNFSFPDEDWATESPILRITAKTIDPDESQLIAAAIASEYTDFLDERNRGISNELRDLIVKAKEDLLSDLRRLDKEYDQFRASAPVVWKDGTAINIHHERQLELEKARKELLVRISALKARTTKVTNAVAEGGRAFEAVYFEAIKELGTGAENETSRTETGEFSGAETLSKRLYDEYANLLFEERQMMEKYGKGHPDISAVRNRRIKLARLIESQTARRKSSGSVEPKKKEFNYPLIYQKFLSEQMTELDDQLNRLNEAFKAEEEDAVRIETFVQKDQALRREMDRTQSLFDALVARLDEISIIQNYKGDRATVIETARPGKKIGKSLVRLGALCTMIGLILGSVTAFGLEMMDDSFSDPGEIREQIGVPILAHVPGFKPNPDLPGDNGRLHTFHSPKSRVAESFRGIRNKIFFASMREDMRVIQVTSPLPGDGKSTVISNLAVAIATSGKSVVLVDADCRRPRLHRIFNVKSSRGLVEVLRRECEVKNALVQTEIDGLKLLPAGSIPDNPAELLISNRFSELLTMLKKNFDFVLVDSPPMLAVSDGSGIASKTDGVVLVLRLNKRAKATSTRTMQLLNDIQANVFGLVVNGVESKNTKHGYKGGYGYGNYGGYGYGYDAYGKEMSAYYTDKNLEIDGEQSGNGELLTKSRTFAKEKQSANLKPR